MMKRNLCFVCLMLALCCALSGCFRSAGDQEELQATPEPSGAPYITGDPAAALTPAPTASDAQSDVPGTANDGQRNAQDDGQQPPRAAFDWTTQAEAVEARINLFSEIQDSRVVIADDTALVGVRFASQYQGQLTQRIRDMVAGEVMAADNRIQVVAVTAQAEDVEQIYRLAQRQRGGEAGGEALAAEVKRIARNATSLR